jgi:hypothetical protein
MSESKIESHKKWSGIENRDQVDLCYNWPEGASMVKANMSALLGESKTHRIWNEENGDHFSVDRAREGLPPLQKRIRKAGENSGRIKKIYVNVTEHVGVTAKQMTWKSATACALVDGFEGQGIRTEVILVHRTKRVSEGGAMDFGLEVPLKQAQEPLNISLLAGCLSPWMFRCHLIAVQHRTVIENGYKNDYGHGCPVPIGEKEGAIVIDSGMCLSKEESMQFLAKVQE